MRMIGFLYGVISYAVFLASFLYAIGFVGNLLVPKSIDSGPSGSLGEALLVNVVLLGLFAIQHSVMARPVFKTWWTKIVPKSVERSTYVLISSLLLALLFWKWEAMIGVIWSVENQTARMGLNALFWLGWLIVLLSTFMINHFDLFGLRQVYLRLRSVEYTHLRFTTSALYKFVRHPIMLGFLIQWPTLITLIMFPILVVMYMRLARREEKESLAEFGETYEKYAAQTPAFLPRLLPVETHQNST